MGVVAAAFFLSLAYVGPSHGDDVFIYMRYADNILKSSAIEYNVGEKSNGITSELLLAIMAPIARLAGNSVTTWKIFSSICFAGTAGLAFLVFQNRHATPLLPLSLTVALVFEPHLLRWSGAGMENSLVALGLAASLLVNSTLDDASRVRAALFGSLLGSLGAVRPELMIFAAAYCALAFRFRPKTAAFLAIGAALAAAGSSVVTYITTGFPFPQTASAKAIFLVQPFFSVAALLPIPLIILSGSTISTYVAARTFQINSKATHWALATGGFCLCVIGYLLVQHSLISTRYDASLSFPLLLSATYCASEYVAQEPTRQALRLAALFICVQLSAALIVLCCLYPLTRNSEEVSIRRFSRQTNALTTPQDRIALSEIGAFGFYSERYIIDLIGLVDPQTLAWGRRHGRPDSLPKLEALLRFRKATYFVCTFCAHSNDIVGRTMTFQPVYAQRVSLENGVINYRRDHPLWVLYRLEDRIPDPALRRRVRLAPEHDPLVRW